MGAQDEFASTQVNDQGSTTSTKPSPVPAWASEGRAEDLHERLARQRRRRWQLLWLVPTVLVLIAICARHFTPTRTPTLIYVDADLLPDLPAPAVDDVLTGHDALEADAAFPGDARIGGDAAGDVPLADERGDTPAPPPAQGLHAHARSWLSHHLRIIRRQESSASNPPSTPTSNPDPTLTSTNLPLDTSAPSVPETPLPVPTPFPQPFDETLSYNFSTIACQTFFTNFTLSPSFRTCRPFSLLLSSSAEFLAAQFNLTLLTAIVGGTCNTPTSAEQCESNMDWFASAIQSVCAKDLSDRNALAHQALEGFQSYTMYRQAACLRNQRTNAYCYPEAIGATSPANAYYYSLGLGVPVPNDTVPSCDPCLQGLMKVYANAAGDSDLLIAKTYARAAQMTNNVCGPTFAQVTPQAANAGDATRRMELKLGVVVGSVLLGLCLAVLS